MIFSFRGCIIKKTMWEDILMKPVKIILGLFIALISIGVVCVLALRYLDVLMKPVEAIRSVFNKRGVNFCDCGDEDCEENF